MAKHSKTAVSAGSRPRFAKQNPEDLAEFANGTDSWSRPGNRIPNTLFRATRMSQRIREYCKSLSGRALSLEA
jgi:hypothetical protein